MSEWQPKKFDENPQVNALLNIAASIQNLASAAKDISYAMKAARGSMSVGFADIVDEGFEKIAQAIGEGMEDLKIQISSIQK